MPYTRRQRLGLIVAGSIFGWAVVILMIRTFLELVG
jgi:hypothetical protein